MFMRFTVITDAPMSTMFSDDTGIIRAVTPMAPARQRVFN